MSTLSGLAQKEDGSPVENVRVFSWQDGVDVIQATPDAQGQWSVTVPATDNYGITYLGGANQPVTHGPYYIEVTSVPWYPTDLFSNGELGVDYDPSDVNTLFMDTAGTVSVTGDGDAVAYMADKSGNGFHATQPDAAKRPLYRTDGTLHWLEFDGVDDHLLITSGSLTGAFVTGFAVQYTDTSTQRILLGHSSNSSKYGVVSDTRDVFFRAVDGGGAVDVDVTNHVLTDSLWSGYRDTADNVFARLKGQAVGSVAGQAGAAEFDVLGGTVYSTVIDLNFQGKFYGLTLASGHSLDAAERLEGYMAHRLGLAADLPAAHPYKAASPTKEPVQALAVPDSRYRVDDLTQLAATQVIRDQFGGRDFFTENLTTATVNSENAIYFNGTNARAYSVRMPFNDDFTINMWVSLPNPNDSDGCWLISNRTDNVGYAEQEFQLSVRTVADTATLWARNTAGTTFSAESSVIPANTKVLLSGVWEGDTLHIYLNGQLDQSVVFTGTRNKSAACTVLGQRGWEFFDSSPGVSGFGEFHLYGMDLYYSKALSASEIAAIYAAGM